MYTKYTSSRRRIYVRYYIVYVQLNIIHSFDCLLLHYIYPPPQMHARCSPHPSQLSRYPVIQEGDLINLSFVKSRFLLLLLQKKYEIVFNILFSYYINNALSFFSSSCALLHWFSILNIINIERKKERKYIIYKNIYRKGTSITRLYL